MKKINFLVIALALIFVLTGDVYATSGALRKNSIKTCPDGITYGLHGDGNKGTHWHVAEAKSNVSSGWAAVGEPLSGDPCPNSNSSNTTSNANSNQSINAIVVPSNSDKSSSSSVSEKSSDITISYIKINGNMITKISDEMEYEIDTKNVEIEVVLKSGKASYELIGPTEDLSIDEINNIEIKVTAEDGTQKSYLLKITRIYGKSNVSIKVLKINDVSVTFDSTKKASTTEMYMTSSIKIYYELSDTTATIQLYKDGKEVNIDDEIDLEKGNNEYEIKITDQNGKVAIYELSVDRLGLISSILSVLIVIAIPIVIIKIVIDNKKRKKAGNNEVRN